jgi:hypothetical protein
MCIHVLACGERQQCFAKKEPEDLSDDSLKSNENAGVWNV